MSLLGFAAAFCFRQFGINKHLATLNRQRANALSSFDLIRVSAEVSTRMEQMLYYSTIPQVLAALVATVGIFVLYRLPQLDDQLIRIGLQIERENATSGLVKLAQDGGADPGPISRISDNLRWRQVDEIWDAIQLVHRLWGTDKLQAKIPEAGAWVDNDIRHVTQERND